MTEAPARPLTQTFMTHAMKDEDIAALSTGRDDEFRRIMDAIARSRRASPGSLQHVILYGSRGFGKSFMTRRLQIAVERLHDDLGPVRYLLLPEEQHNLQRSPHAFLDAIVHTLADHGQDDDRGFEAALFQWPKPGEEAKRWDDAAARLEAAVDAAFPGGKGLVIVVFENFDVLLATLFKEPEDEQRLRAWLDRRRNRVMLLATATGTVDLDYEKPLFQAFDSVRLAPWTVEDCIAYFDRHRARDGRPPLDAEQAAKARAIADFIGGTPRLAQLLADVLDTQDALTVAQTMSALADKLAEYYRRRIEDLPPLGRGLLDALIRGGEPASQTELAVRVGADGQNLIARPMGDLQAADIVRGRPAPDGRETLYSATDRVFVHYYRLRQRSKVALTTPLATILDFLKSFYSRDEQRAQGLKHLEAGRPAEAALFSRLAMEGEARGSDNYTKHFAYRLESYLDAAPDALGMDAAAIAAMLERDPASAFELCRTVAPASPAASAIVSVLRAQALHRLGHSDRAAAELETAAAEATDAASNVIARDQLATYRLSILKNSRGIAELIVRLKPIIKLVDSKRLSLRGLMSVAWSLVVLKRIQEAVGVAEDAANLAMEIGDKGDEARALGHLAVSLGRLGRHEEAVAAAGRAAALAEEVGDKGEQSVSLRYMAFSLSALGRHDRAMEVAGRAAALAEELGDKGEQAASLGQTAFSLGQLGRHEEVVEVAGRAAALAEEVGDKGEQAASLRFMAFSLGALGRREEAVEVAGRAAALAEEVGDQGQQSGSLRLLAFSLGQLSRHEEVVEVAGRAAALAEEVGDKGEQAASLRFMAFSLGALGRREEAFEVAGRAAALAEEVGDQGQQSGSLRLLAFSLGQLGRHEEVVEVAGRAAALAQEVGDKGEQAVSLRCMAFSLGQLGRHQEAVEVAGRAAAFATEVGDKGEQARSLGHMAFTLGALGRHEEVVEVAGRAAALAEEVGDKGEQAGSLRHMAFSLGRLRRYAEAWTAAAACIALADGDSFNLSWGTAEALKAAAHVPRPEVVAFYARWVEAWRASAENTDIANPRYRVDDLFVAVARARAFDELDALLSVEDAWFTSSDVLFVFWSESGEVIARVADAEGRAAGYEAAAGLLPRIAAFMERVPVEERDPTWLPDIISGFARTCRDPGLLRDVATLLTPDLAPQAPDSAKFLRALATVDEAPDAVKALARMDPDLATLIRRLRHIPDPPPIPPKRKPAHPRKRTG